ncbi:MAG: helix-turn-helix domain-containing protein [Nocardioidaceae bacterium]
MRGAGDHLSVGERIAFYRRRRGLTQGVLANLVGRSEDWLSKIERGKRELHNLDLLVEVAKHLRVTVGDLLGQPVLMEDESDPRGDDIPAVRDALMAPRRLSRVLYGRTATPQVKASSVRVFAEQGWADFQRGRLGKVVEALPGLIRSAQALEDLDDASNGRWAVSARIHHLAASALSKVGEADLAWLAAERAMHAADQADDPLVLASAARAGTHALLASGRYSDAMDLGLTAAKFLSEHMNEQDPEALSLLGMLYLRTAAASARHDDRATTTELLGRAASAAAQLGEDANYWLTAFGPTNVELHRMATSLDLGDFAYVVEHAPRVSADHMPLERAVTFSVDTAYAQSLLARDDDALQVLLDAEDRAPQLVRHSTRARETVRAMQRRASVTGRSKSSPLLALAERCRAV